MALLQLLSDIDRLVDEASVNLVDEAVIRVPDRKEGGEGEKAGDRYGRHCGDSEPKRLDDGPCHRWSELLAGEAVTHTSNRFDDR